MLKKILSPNQEKNIPIHQDSRITKKLNELYDKEPPMLESSLHEFQMASFDWESW
jgi:hypothetical protein